MGHIEDRWYRVVKTGDGKPQREKTELFGKGLRYRVRFIAPDGKERSKSFPDRAKRAAEAFLVEVESQKRRGAYIDPAAGRITFGEYAGTWLEHQTFDESTREVTERRLRRHVRPHLGRVELTKIRPTHIRELDRQLQVDGRATSFRAVVLSNVASILNAAVDDELIAKNPCQARSFRLPRGVTSKVIPWTADQVFLIQSKMPSRYQISADLAGGCGMRQGEVLAFSPDDVDDERGLVHVVRQLKIVRNRPVFALPKGRKTRDVPLSSSIADRLREHLRQCPAVEVTLPWESPDGPPMTVTLVLSGKSGVALRRSIYNRDVWWPAAEAAGIVRQRQNGMHALRHFYASVLLDAGESIKALAEYLGHANPGFTLRTYTHLMPSSEERTRRAIDEVFGRSDRGETA